MLNGFMPRSLLEAINCENVNVGVLTEATEELDGGDYTNGSIEPSVVDDVDRNDIFEEEQPILESAVTLCQTADDSWLLMENAIIKIQSKAMEFSAMLEAATDDGQKQVAKDGAFKIATKAIGTVVLAMVERLKQLLSTFLQGLDSVNQKLTAFFTNVESWAVKAEKELESVNDEAINSYEFKKHEWKNALDFSNSSSLIAIIDKTLPVNPSNPHDALRQAQNMSMGEFKSKILAKVGIKNSESVISDLHAYLRGSELTGRTNKAGLIKLINTTKMCRLSITATSKAFKEEVTSKLKAELSAIGKIPKNSTNEDDHVMAQYMTKRTSFLQQAIALTNLLISTEISSRREMCMEYMRIINGGISHAKGQLVK